MGYSENELRKISYYFIPYIGFRRGVYRIRNMCDLQYFDPNFGGYISN